MNADLSEKSSSQESFSKSQKNNIKSMYYETKCVDYVKDQIFEKNIIELPREYVNKKVMSQ